MTHKEIGLGIMALGMFIGLLTIVQWARFELDKARDRSAKRDLSDTLANIPVIEGCTWPEGEAEQHLLGDDWYDPVADADAFIERGWANTRADIARMRADTEAFKARRLFDEADTITIDIGGRQDE
jgi:hypothetical protein